MGSVSVGGKKREKIKDLKVTLVVAARSLCISGDHETKLMPPPPTLRRGIESWRSTSQIYIEVSPVAALTRRVPYSDKECVLMSFGL